jgi:translation elongation factor EF-G
LVRTLNLGILAHVDAGKTSLTERLLFAAGAAVPYHRLRGALAAQARQGLVHPVFFGSARTGAGVDALTAGITELLPTAGGDADGPVSGAVFKVERGRAGERIAYARLFSGTLRARDRLQFGRDGAAKVTAISAAPPTRGRCTSPSPSSPSRIR